LYQQRSPGQHHRKSPRDFDKMFVDMKGTQVIKLDETIPKNRPNQVENLDRFANLFIDNGGTQMLRLDETVKKK